MADGVILYDGPSTFNHAPIVAIGTNITRPSKNPKTEWMVQVWFFLRDIPPAEAALNGADEAVCGDCALRTVLVRVATRKGYKLKQKRPCYVKLFKPASNIWRAYRAGKYQPANMDDWQAITTRLPVRFGAYGDPAAIPLENMVALAEPARAHRGLTGYTHFWRQHPGLRQWLMASVETQEQFDEAKALGWRTFRSLDPENRTLNKREILCPYPFTACARCLLCDGLKASTDRRADIAIPAHGAGAKLFRELFAETHTKQLTVVGHQQ